MSEQSTDVQITSVDLVPNPENARLFLLQCTTRPNVSLRWIQALERRSAASTLRAAANGFQLDMPIGELARAEDHALELRDAVEATNREIASTTEEGTQAARKEALASFHSILVEGRLSPRNA